ncbi:hypothetical protein HZS_867 [Henneguya salminicola]|nr:hypothetical protein HZS_867 [Henneguya salminicola]
MNHKCQLDWFFYMFFSYYHQTPRNLKYAIKNSLKYIPILGWIGQTLVHLFLKRDVISDQYKISQYIKYMKKLFYPVQLVIYCEGTNLEPNTHAQSCEYARKKGFPEYQHVLHPKITGFKFLVQGLRGLHGDIKIINCIYDCTIGYRGYEAFGDITTVLGKLTDEVHIHVERFDIDSLPVDDDKLEDWLKDRWLNKEKSLNSFYKNGHFTENPPLLKNEGRNDFFLKFLIYNVAVVVGAWALVASKFLAFLSIFHFIISFIVSSYYGFDNMIINFHDDL